MAIAAIWGTTAGYTEYGDNIIVETIDGRVAVINRSTFDYLYNKLNNYVAALKEDCIQYVVHQPEVCLFEYPKWYIDAVYDGCIYENHRGSAMFYEEDGEIAMSPNSIVLRNYKGELKYLEGYKFHQYYDTLEE